MKLLQLCNVGNICGGTAACAWSVVRALPDCEHHIAFFSKVTGETREAFSGHEVQEISALTQNVLTSIQPDVLLMHNTHPSRVKVGLDRFPIRTIQYLHSQITAASAQSTICCSRWLADRMQLSDKAILWQGVPRPPELKRCDDSSLVVGRICTPTSSKWPVSLVPFYAELSRRVDSARWGKVSWEFVGCPEMLQSPLQQAVCGRASFYPAGWQARSRLWTWDILLHHQPDVTESFGRTVAEAMRVSCLPIVDDQGGFREQIDEETGFLCSHLDDFVEAFKIIADPSVRRARRVKSREHAERCFSLAAFRERLTDLLLAKPSSEQTRPRLRQMVTET